ncbi:MAG: VWA domain-containing protein [Crenarchaeota archaeon]|nr:VWA domain-containing protein [Thermoproteota archaeon]
MKEFYTIDEINCSELREIVDKVSRLYNLFPGFVIKVDSIKSAWYTQWGTILLPEPPEGTKLPDFNKYFLLLGLGYHSILPATELNRLIILAAARRTLGNCSSEVHGSLLSVLCLFVIFAKLSNQKHISSIVKESIEGILKSKPTSSTPLGSILREFYEFVLGRKISSKTMRIINVALADMPLYAKAKIFFRELLAEIDTLDPWSLHERELRKYLIPISANEVMNSDSIPISLQEMEQLSEIDYDFAKEVAKKLDKQLEIGKLPIKEPAFSQDKTILQKMLNRRRYLAAARRARIRAILSLIEEKIIEIEPQTSRYGFCEWYMGDDEEKMNIEISADTFGRVIPDVSTLQDLREIGGDLNSLERSIRHMELVIDTSGSMSDDPIERAIDVGMALVEIAKKYGMSVGLSTFSSGAWEGVPPTFNYDAIEEIILRLDSEGGTNIRNVLSVVDNHLSSLYDRTLVAIITDTAIYDIKFPEVINSLMNVREKSILVFFAITQKLWEKTEDVLKTLNIPVIILPPNITECEEIEIIIRELTRISQSTVSANDPL